MGGHSSGITDEPTIVVGRKGSIGSVTWIDGPAWPIDTAYFVKPRVALDRRWAYWLLKSLRLDTMNKSAAVPGLNRDDVYRLQVEVPPLSEQRRIAAILDHADAVRVKRRQGLAHLDALTQSIFHEMFGVHGFNSLRLKDAIKWSSGKFLPARGQHGGPHPIYGGNGINGWHDSYLFQSPQLIVGRVGAYCGAVHVTQPFAWVTDNALVATLMVTGLTLEYLQHALRIANLNQYSGASGQPSISSASIGNVHLPLPPLSLQREFTSRIDQASEQVAKTRLALAVDDQLFASLQSRAFRGEL